MNYEIAEQLRDAGFPNKRMWIVLDKQIIQGPTLSELIEACGYGFRELTLHTREDGHKWMAKAGKRSGGFLKNGFTPEEAVAKLWLALQDKSNAPSI